MFQTLLGLAFLLGGPVWVAWSVLKRAKLNGTLVQRGVLTTATVVKLKQNWGEGMPPWECIVEFEAEPGQWQRATVDERLGEEGEAVRILYDPQNPSDLRRVEPAPDAEAARPQLRTEWRGVLTIGDVVGATGLVVIGLWLLLM